MAVRSNPSSGVDVGTGVSVSTATDLKVNTAASFGAGLNFRLSRSFSLRGEFREFRSTTLPGVRGGQSYPSTHVGFVFHH